MNIVSYQWNTWSISKHFFVCFIPSLCTHLLPANLLISYISSLISAGLNYSNWDDFSKNIQWNKNWCITRVAVKKAEEKNVEILTMSSWTKLIFSPFVLSIKACYVANSIIDWMITVDRCSRITYRLFAEKSLAYVDR
jgi:hypothetical protein